MRICSHAQQLYPISHERYMKIIISGSQEKHNKNGRNRELSYRSITSHENKMLCPSTSMARIAIYEKHADAHSSSYKETTNGLQQNGVDGKVRSRKRGFWEKVQ